MKMNDSAKAFNTYIHTIEEELALGNATEHTHRPALKALFESLDESIKATNEPRRVECGAPDFIITRGSIPVGYVEAKEVGKNLDNIEQGKGADGERFSRYMIPLTNLILTDYLEFRWYIDGKLRLHSSLGTPGIDGKIKRDKAGIEAVTWLIDGFLSHQAEPIGTSKELAQRMAHLTHMIRDLIIVAFTKEPDRGSLHAQFIAFKDNLIPDLSAEQFADMYAQTVAYGLFAARHNQVAGTGFTRQNAAYLLPKTNLFLRKLFNHIAGPDLDERIAWLVDDLAQLLAQADMEAILKDFGKRTAREDPVLHFYETFLASYDHKLRKSRGVYYTPEPVVSYIVRSIDYLLKTSFNKPQGLADDNTFILDPAVGTATFLYMVINEIFQANVAKGQQGLWNNYVSEKLLHRIFGFELLMAPYAMAHLKLGLLLKETGYQFEKEQRLGIYLTNTLEEAVKHSETIFANWITEEANAAARVKKDESIMVVLGNPPYSGNSANKSKWITQLIEDYKQVDGKSLEEKNPKALQDDYVKFIRFGQWRIDKTGRGILVFITNHSYLDNPTFRGMRQSLMNTFTDIYILNLHGNAKKKEVAPDGGKDENIFDIQQGVTIGLFIKEPGKTEQATVHYADLWGLRGNWPNPQQGTKYYALAESYIALTDWFELQPNSPFYFFVPREEKSRPEYESCWKVNDVYPVNSDGIKTHRDNFVLDFDRSALKERMLSFRGIGLSGKDICCRFGLTEREGWSIADAQKSIREDNDWEGRFRKYLYRPFDIRHIFYHESVIDRARTNIMRHMLSGQNLAICVGRAGQVVGPGVWDVLFCSNSIEDCNLFYRGGTVNLPLYLYPSEGEMQFEGGHRRPNLNLDFIKAFSEKLGLEFVEDGRGDLKQTFGPEDIFNYAYAVFHSPTYRTRYAEFLKIDFPRLPLTSDRNLFKALIAKGAEIASLHLIESAMLDRLITRYPVVGPNHVEKVRYDEANQRVYINKSQYFEGVSPEVWNFHIGGYQVCQKWLKDRKSRTLNHDELTHYQRIVVALKETIRLMQEIDVLIPNWPIE